MEKSDVIEILNGARYDCNLSEYLREAIEKAIILLDEEE